MFSLSNPDARNCVVGKIKNIVTELNSNADEVVTAVEKSMTATEKQNEMIITAADNFEKLDKNILPSVLGISTVLEINKAYTRYRVCIFFNKKFKIVFHFISSFHL